MSASIPSSDILVDALPYIDQGYDEPGVKEAVLAMIEEEAQRKRPTKNYLEHLEPLKLHQFETDLMRNEMARMERMERDHRKEKFDVTRYDVPRPNKDDERSWLRALENSEAQLVHQEIRLRNLDLMRTYGGEAWKKYNEQLSSLLNESQKQLTHLKKQIQEINWERKKKQTDAGEKLKILEAEWVSLVTKNFEIERACSELEKSNLSTTPTTGN